jgi:two-component system LytT family sensor kinase
MGSFQFTLSKIFTRRLSLHILFWIGVFVFNLLEDWSYSDDKHALIELYVTKLPVQMLVAYWLTYFQLPQYLIKKRYVRFFISLFLSVYLTCILYVTYRVLYFEPAHPGYFRAPLPQTWFIYFDLIKFVMYATSFYIPALIMAGIKLIRIQYEEQQKLQLLEKEKLQTELSFLKNQLNPHFLFNTLNNLYMLTLKSSPQAPEVVAKLSETLDYILYRCHEKVVPLTGEIQLIQNYLTLEKIRHHEFVSINFNCKGEFNSKSIAPLIMLSLVENAFKHGINKHPGPSQVTIILAVKDEELNFSVYNSKWNDVDQAGKSNGIGLKNIQRQLELIYPDNHSIHIDDQENSYFVRLKINLHHEIIS